MESFISFIKKNKLFTFLCMIALLLILICVFVPYIAPNDPLKTNMANSLQGSSSRYPLGTDNLGRCLLSRLLYGAVTSLKLTFWLVITVFIVGTTVGTIAGYFGGIADTIIMRLSDIFLAFPSIIFAIAIVGILGASSVNTVMALLVVDWVKYARVSKSLVISIKKKDYIKAAKMGGAKEYQIIFKYILPNIIPSLVVMATMDLGTMMLQISSLSFLGLGAQPPTPEWGNMLNEGKDYMQTLPGLMIYPGVGIFITVMVFNLLGDSMRDILDPNEVET
ncbi:ABC transporter permease subunit [Clostridium sp. PL3]|uniref:ABC transporter permease subunit n=1 Tax=Clostridium thailandense TaxID=2794346 RepID=A0A949TVR0_9CLOT|nr:nickel transporter permease [Clostridium thailandense]MBV7276222.1 ABC transporter permease subunit [Clostridium thailandense]